MSIRARLSRLISRKAYAFGSPDQPRDESGKWTSGGGSAGGGAKDDSWKNRVYIQHHSAIDRYAVHSLKHYGKLSPFFKTQAEAEKHAEASHSDTARQNVKDYDNAKAEAPAKSEAATRFSEDANRLNTATMHGQAAEAHRSAAKSHETLGNKDEQAAHEAKAKEHLDKAKTLQAAEAKNQNFKLRDAQKAKALKGVSTVKVGEDKGVRIEGTPEPKGQKIPKPPAKDNALKQSSIAHGLSDSAHEHRLKGNITIHHSEDDAKAALAAPSHSLYGLTHMAKGDKHVVVHSSNAAESQLRQDGWEVKGRRAGEGKDAMKKQSDAARKAKGGWGTRNLSRIVSAKVANPKKKPTETPKDWACALLPFAATEAVAIPKGPNDQVGPDQDNQQKMCRFCKDVIAAGSYSHPVAKWKLDVDEKRMDKWCAAFDKMMKDGIKVPIYADHKPSAQNHLGYLSALCRGGPEAMKKFPELAKLPYDQAPMDPKRLYGIHEFKDDAAASMAKGVGQVSVLIDKDFTSGSGKKYGEAIRHVAVTPEPVVANQQGFQSMAASLQGEHELSAAVFVIDIDKADQAETRSMLTENELALAREHFSEEEQKDLTADNALEKLLKKYVELSTLAVEQAEKIENMPEGSAELSREIDPEALDMLVEGTTEKIQSLVAKGKLTPAVAKKLELALVGPENARNVYALSRHVSKLPKALAATIIEALAENNPVPLGEKTRAQHVTLSRQVPGGDAKDVDEGMAKAMDEAANRGRKDRK